MKKRETNGDNTILKVVNEIERLICPDMYFDDTIGDLRKNFPLKIEKTKEAITFVLFSNELKNLRTEIPGESNF